MVLLVFMTTFEVANGNIWKASEGVYRYGHGNGFYSMFIVTDGGVIAIEPINTGHSQGLLKAIKQVTNQPVRYLLHSHNHWDHSKGGKVFRDEGAKIVAHEDAYVWMKANPHREMILPDEVWSGSQKDIILGNTTLEMHHIGVSHGAGMSVFLLPKEKIIYIADLVSPNGIPYTIIPDMNIKGWIRALAKIEKMDFEKAIFAHSFSQKPFGGKTDVILLQKYIKDMQTAIKDEFKKGTPAYRIPNLIKLPQYEHMVGYKQWLPMNAWRFVLDMDMGPWSHSAQESL